MPKESQSRRFVKSILMTKIMEDKAFIKLLTNECNNSNYFIILRYQKRKTVAINFDGDEFTYYYDDDDEGIGIQSISNKDRMVFLLY